ncbi:MAG: hypothetical protein JKY37_27560 [Nannocystaceae bacterium]|nr:hypothetical protein [Nannocystaceae bacterium]
MSGALRKTFVGSLLLLACGPKADNGREPWMISDYVVIDARADKSESSAFRVHADGTATYIEFGEDLCTWLYSEEFRWEAIDSENFVLLPLVDGEPLFRGSAHGRIEVTRRDCDPAGGVAYFVNGEHDFELAFFRAWFCYDVIDGRCRMNCGSDEDFSRTCVDDDDG